MRWFKTLLWMIFFVLAVLFAMQNKEQVTLAFGFCPFQIGGGFVIQDVPLFIPVLFGILLGTLAGGVGDFLRRLQLKRQLRQSQRTIQRLEQEICTLHHSDFSAPSPETSS